MGTFSTVVKRYLKEEKLQYVFCSSMWLFQACWGHGITIGWLIDVEVCVQSTVQRPSATLKASTAYQTLPIVEAAFLEDNSTFVSYILVMTLQTVAKCYFSNIGPNLAKRTQSATSHKSFLFGDFPQSLLLNLATQEEIVDIACKFPVGKSAG